MPVIDGKVRRSRFTSLKLRELSSVDNPAQPGARAVIMKRNFSSDERQRLAGTGAALPDGSYPIENTGDLENAVQAFGRAKNPGKVKSHIISRARSLDAVDKLPADWNVTKFQSAIEISGDVARNHAGMEAFEDLIAAADFDKNLWPCVDELSQSIRSVVGDGSLAGGERDARISASVVKFLQSVAHTSPEVSKQLERLLVKGEDPMPKTVEELQADVAKLEGQVSELTAKLSQAEKDKAKAMQDAEDEAEQCATAKAALAKATDETLKVGDVEVKKSEVGEAQFKLTKGLQDEARMAKLEKRASDDFSHVVGTEAEKALVLKSIDGLADDNLTRKALEAIMTSCEKMAAAGFSNIGSSRGEASPDVKKAQGTFDGKVSEIAARDKITKSQAMSKARHEFPTEFADAYPEQAPVN